MVSLKPLLETGLGRAVEPRASCKCRLVERPNALPSTDGHGMAMLQKLMVFTSENALHEGQPVHRAIVQRLRRSGARGATALRGIWGFAGDGVAQLLVTALWKFGDLNPL